MSLYLGETPIAVNSSSREIGEIIQSTIPLSDAGLHLLDGALISGSGSYADFVTYMAGLVSSYSDCFCSEADWQTSVTNYGVCGKFVYDSVNNTVRLPKITGFTEGTIDPTVLGDLVEAGLPNITGKLGVNADRNTFDASQTGAFYRDATGGRTWAAVQTSPAQQYGDIGIDASRSSAIYGNSSTVQPQSIKVLYYIVTANSVKTNIEVDIDEVMTDLNGKADTGLTNITSTAKASIVHNAMPSGTVITGIFTSPITTTGQTYTAPADGYVMVGASVGIGKALEIDVDGRPRFYQYVNAGHSFGNYTPVRKGQTVRVFVSYGGGSSTLENSYFEYAVGTV